MESLASMSDDMLIYLTQFLDDKDCLSLAYSGVNPSFVVVYGKFMRRQLSMSHVFSSTPERVGSLFQYVISERLTVFNISNCYWLPIDLMLPQILRMENLLALYLNDTLFSITELSPIFQACPKIVKLSISLKESSVNAVNNVDEATLLGFSRLSHLALFMFNQDPQSWLLTLRVLSWCSALCTHLFISVAYGETRLLQEQDAFASAQMNLIPFLMWMKALTSFVVVRSGALEGDVGVAPESFLSLFLEWLLLVEPIPQNLEEIWIDHNTDIPLRFARLPNAPLLRGITLQESAPANLVNNPVESIRQAQELAGIVFTPMVDFTELKSVRGYYHWDEGLNEFCAAHPQLEELKIQQSRQYEGGQNQHVCTNLMHNLDVQWYLPNLKVFVNRENNRCQGCLARIVASCPNLQELHIGKKDKRFILHRPVLNKRYFSAISFTNLKLLDISGCYFTPGDYFTSVIQNCPQLQQIHLEGAMKVGLVFKNITDAICVPTKLNLRELRLKWKANDEMDCYHLLLLLAELVKYSSYLERLVFIRDSELYDDDVGVKPASSLTIQVADIVPFIAAMPYLVALCLAGFQIDPPHVKLFQSRLNEEILPFRPYLWLHVGPQLPLGNDPNFCPRVHYEEIVNPSDSYYAARSATRF